MGIHLQVDTRMEDFQRLSTDTVAGDIGAPDRQGLTPTEVWEILEIAGCFPKTGDFPPKWMVKIRESPIRIDDLGVPLFSETSS